jgi:hypothetical protein
MGAIKKVIKDGDVVHIVANYEELVAGLTEVSENISFYYYDPVKRAEAAEDLAIIIQALRAHTEKKKKDS